MILLTDYFLNATNVMHQASRSVPVFNYNFFPSIYTS